MSTPRDLAALAALALGACAEPAPDPYCGGFDEPLAYELSLAKLTLDVDDYVPVEGELCLELPRRCDCVPTDANGFLRVEAPARSDLLAEVHAPGYLTTVLVHTSTDVPHASTLRVLDRATVMILGGAIGERTDRTRGQMAIRAAPAEGGDVTGTVFSLRNLDTGAEERVIYTAGGVPSVDATATDATGVAIGVNLPVGRYEIASPVFATCSIHEAGWPRYDAEGRVRALELVVRADSVTLLDTLRCFGP